MESWVREAEAKVRAQVKLPEGYTIEFGGQFENLLEAKARLMVVVPAALLFIFVLIFLAFGSVRQALLVYSGIKLLRQGETEIHPEKNPVLRLFRKVMPVTKDYVGGKFLVRNPGLYATPLLVVLILIETTDVLFAVDSIPAVLAITLDAFIVYTSNIFAILGLRSMYFALAGMMDLFHFLHYGLSVVLIFVGVKMIGAHYFHVPTIWTLAVVVLVLGTSIVASLLHPKKKIV